MANIALELGFAAMCGKPLVIAKSAHATAPSDLKRTDWIEYAPGQPAPFVAKIGQAIDEIERTAEWEWALLTVALESRSMDCAVAFERANKGFLLSGDDRFVAACDDILRRLDDADEGPWISDLERLRGEVRAFVKQARMASGR